MPALKKSKLQEQADAFTKAANHALIDKMWTKQHLADLLKMDRARVSLIINHPLSRRTEDVLKVANKLGIDVMLHSAQG